MFSETFCGNTVAQWALAAVMVVGALVVGKTLYWLIGKTVKRLATKTRTRLDDILVDMLEEPIVFAVIIVGIYYGLKWPLGFTTKTDEWIDKIVKVLLIVDLAWLITRVFDSLVEEYLIPFARKTESDLDDHLVPVIRKGMQVSVWTIALITAMDTADIPVFSLLTGLGIGGLAFALAAQETVGNFFGSIAIFLDKPFKIGDRIQVEGFDGVVTEIGLRSTRIRTRYQGRIVSIPNMKVAKADVVNVDSENGRQVFSVYRLTSEMNDEQISLAMELLKQIASSDRDTQEKVVSGFFAITEYSRDIMLLYWVKPDASNLETRTRINLEIVRQFKKNNIELTKATPVHAKLDRVELL